MILQFQGQIDASARQEIEGLGGRILGYLPEDALVVQLPPDATNKVLQNQRTRWLGEYQPAFRVAPDLLKLESTELIDLEIGLWKGESAARLRAELDRLGAQSVKPFNAAGEGARLLCRIDPGDIPALASLDEVQWIERAPVLTRRNNTTEWVLQSNVSGSLPIWNQGLHGEGQIIGHLDGEIDMDSCFFEDTLNGNIPGPSHRKIVAYYEPQASEYHGTHTAGTIAGSLENGSTIGVGHAYAARLAHGLDLDVAGYLDTPSTLLAAFLRAKSDGAFIHSNSWGDDSRTNYTYWCRDIDQFSWENEDSFVVFAATNLPGLKSPENAKNCLSTFATYQNPSQDSIAYGGSGPTDDGRRKPEIGAPGRFIQSAGITSECGLLEVSGTSMSAPAIAGNAALVRQYFMEGFYPSGAANTADEYIPTGSLIKAVLLNSTVDMTGVSGFPGDREGWGRLLLDNSLYFSGDARRLEIVDVWNAQGMETGETREFTVEVQGTAEPLNVTLVWADPPALHSAAQVWINDLNLEVESPDATTYLGNVFSGGVSVSGGAADEKNNVEQVRLTPMAGDWTIRVSAENIPEGPQGFALAITGQINNTGKTSVEDWRRD
ncbi:S8 family serine peptidase [bacterium]|nr:S8 family serine peptidase [bacterium]